MTLQTLKETLTAGEPATLHLWCLIFNSELAALHWTELGHTYTHSEMHVWTHMCVRMCVCFK